MEMLEKDGFGLVRTLNHTSGKRIVFYKIVPNMLDTDLKNHSVPLKMADLTTEQYTTIFKDFTKVHRSIINSHPFLEEFYEYLD